ncbi:thermonuclease family protein [Conchiformibius kuhniae]|uniref:Thermonuclease family protein n=1 Tax=Conchiformibius kuhniae TaxID=211502 RepID=A0A8T9MW58_9NEIS|nr:thermonuclease family protein [Conchiformibius kuhniae]
MFPKPNARQRKKLYQTAAALITAAVVAIFGISSGSNSSKEYTGTVIAVTDGDTVRLTDHNGQAQRIRMAFIDAPESAQAHGKASQNALKKMIEGKKVRVEVVDTDQYRRQVARIRINGEDVNFAQIANGHAWHYQSIAKRNQPKDDYTRYETAQAEAKKKRKGLWRDRDALAPWTYRKEKRAGNATE